MRVRLRGSFSVKTEVFRCLGGSQAASGPRNFSGGLCTSLCLLALKKEEINVLNSE